MLDDEVGKGKKPAVFRKRRGYMHSARGSSESSWLQRPKGETEKESSSMKLRRPSPSSRNNLSVRKISLVFRRRL